MTKRQTPGRHRTSNRDITVYGIRREQIDLEAFARVIFLMAHDRASQRRDEKPLTKLDRRDLDTDLRLLQIELRSRPMVDTDKST